MSWHSARTLFALTTTTIPMSSASVVSAQCQQLDFSVVASLDTRRQGIETLARCSSDLYAFCHIAGGGGRARGSSLGSSRGGRRGGERR